MLDWLVATVLNQNHRITLQADFVRLLDASEIRQESKAGSLKKFHKSFSEQTSAVLETKHGSNYTLQVCIAFLDAQERGGAF